MLRLELCDLWKVHVASFVNLGFTVWAVGGGPAAEVRPPCLSAISLDQASDGVAAVAVALAAADLEETNDFKVAEGA